jgi:hypothetical protein
VTSQSYFDCISKKKLNSRNLLHRRINGCLVLRIEQKLLSNGDAHYCHDISIIFKPYATLLSSYCLNLSFNSAVCCYAYIRYTWWMDDWMNENGKLVEWYWRGKREVLIEKPVPLPLFHISHMDWSGIERQPAWRKPVTYPPESWCGHIYVTHHCHYLKSCLIIFGLSLKSDFYNGARTTSVTQLWDEVFREKWKLSMWRINTYVYDSKYQLCLHLLLGEYSKQNRP